MTQEKNVGKAPDQYIVRFPDGMRDSIKVMAATNRRSMNAQIIVMIESAFASAKATTEPSLAALRKSEPA